MKKSPAAQRLQNSSNLTGITHPRRRSICPPDRKTNKTQTIIAISKPGRQRQSAVQQTWITWVPANVRSATSTRMCGTFRDHPGLGNERSIIPARVGKDGRWECDSAQRACKQIASRKPRAAAGKWQIYTAHHDGVTEIQGRTLILVRPSGSASRRNSKGRAHPYGLEFRRSWGHRLRSRHFADHRLFSGTPHAGVRGLPLCGIPANTTDSRLRKDVGVGSCSTPTAFHNRAWGRRDHGAPQSPKLRTSNPNRGFTRPLHCRKPRHEEPRLAFCRQCWQTWGAPPCGAPRL